MASSIMHDEREAVHRVNAFFYRALDNLDLEAMDEVWVHAGPVHCVHSGWDGLSGWSEVRRSWERIFNSTSWIRVTPTRIQVDIFGDVAVVTCTENITAKSEEDVGLAVAQATNLFRKTPEGWRLFHHHASPAPVHVTHPFSGTVQ
jgi:ketosteroid isomerase-like protein